MHEVSTEKAEPLLMVYGVKRWAKGGWTISNDLDSSFDRSIKILGVTLGGRLLQDQDCGGTGS